MVGLEASGVTLSLAAAALLVVFGGLTSGLTLGLLSLDRVELEVLVRSGSAAQQRHARRVIPLVERGHLLLVTLLLCNAAAVEALPVVLADAQVVSHVVAVSIATVLVLVVGEIVPQAVAHRHSLALGAAFAPVVWVLIAVCLPVAYPVACFLTLVVGTAQVPLMRRPQLVALLHTHSAETGLPGGFLSPDETTVLVGALELASKRVREFVTPVADTFMLPADAVLDRECFQKLTAEPSHSRIPIHVPGDNTKLCGLLLVKDLLTISPTDGIPLSAVRIRALNVLPHDTSMYDALRFFVRSRCHLAGVHEEGGKILGVITLEDVIEELLNVEIFDEHDDPATNLANTFSRHRGIVRSSTSGGRTSFDSLALHDAGQRLLRDGVLATPGT